jgi:hypothetical protein
MLKRHFVPIPTADLLTSICQSNNNSAMAVHPSKHILSSLISRPNLSSSHLNKKKFLGH